LEQPEQLEFKDSKEKSDSKDQSE
jgi:hypothetical protein